MYGFDLPSLILCSHMTGVLKPVMALCGGYRTDVSHAQEDELGLHILTTQHEDAWMAQIAAWYHAFGPCLALPLPLLPACLLRALRLFVQKSHCNHESDSSARALSRPMDSGN